MDAAAFQTVKENFQGGDIEKKIDIYISTDGLTHEQYKELLRMFPIDELAKLEAALQ